MDVIRASAKIENPVFRAEFKYLPASGVHRQVGGCSDEEIQRRLTGNIMEVGKPEHWSLKELCKRRKVQLPAQIEMLMTESDFWLIESTFSCVPAPGNRFEWVRIIANLEPYPKDKENTMAYDVFPKDIYEEKKEKRRISIGLNFKFAEIVQAEAQYVREIEFTKLEPIITVAGIGKLKPTWDFRERASFNLSGGHALFIILRTPLDAKEIRMSYSSHAHLQTKWGGLIPTTAKTLQGNETFKIAF
jgi:hypothetical protein